MVPWLNRNSAKSRIDKIITVSQKDAEAMIEEWVIKQN
ncbi:hypothetical protein SynSYN20_00932 [Synechococcus sp. SYN20]|nr:hypothetical protein SynSYN20_00932 [Synechococcus sp. SYN20]